MRLALKLLLWLIIGLALLIAVAFLVASRKATQAEADYPPEGQFITVDGHRVHAIVTGEGPDLVLIHGSSGSTRDFTFGLVDVLKDRYRVIVFDRPGLGYSDPLPGGGTITEQARVLQGAAATLGADMPIVLGQSYGGAVALAWAVEMPNTLSALVPLSSPAQPWNTPLDGLYKVNSSWWAPFTSIPLISAFVPESYVQTQIEGIFVPQDMPEGFDSHIGANLSLRRHSLRVTALQRANLLAEITALQPRYPEITVPVVIIHGDTDTTVSHTIHAIPLAQQLSNAQLSLLPGIGHVPQHVAIEAVSAGIDSAAARAGLR